MYEQSVNAAVATALKKAENARNNPLGYWVASMLAGVYIGIAIILVFTIGAGFANTGHPALRLVLGAAFGIALTLVVFAGAELFTGNVMFLTFGVLRRQCKITDLLRVWVYSWCGNLVGALALAWLTVASGVLTAATATEFVQNVSSAKGAAPVGMLIGRGILCNFLVCLALWTASRTTSDTAKLGLIWWCLFAFIGSGFEHSIANMTLLGMNVFIDFTAPTAWGALWYNLAWVTLGNIFGGAILAVAYHATRNKTTPIAR